MSEAEEQQQHEHSSKSRDDDRRDSRRGDKSRGENGDDDRERSSSSRHERKEKHSSDRAGDSGDERDAKKRREEKSSSDRDRDRDRERRDRGDRDDRRRDDDRSSRRDRDDDRDRDRDKSPRRSTRRDRSRSRSRSPSSKSSRSEKEGPTKRKREKTGWDQPPVPGATFAPPIITGLPLMTHMPMSGVPLTNMLGPMMQRTMFTGAVPTVAVNQNVERQRRRVYVGGLPPNINDRELKAFFNEIIKAKVPHILPGDPVIDATINHDKAYAFIEMRVPSEATKTLALDGVQWMSRALKLRRPNDYQPPAEGEDDAVEHIDGIVSTNVPDTPNKLFIGGLLSTLGEADVRELLTTIGQLKSFNLVKDMSTGLSKGFAFCEYIDDATTERAIAALNQMPIGDKTLLVQRAMVGARNKGGEVIDDNGKTLSADNFPVLQPGELVTPDTPAGIFLAPVPLPHLLAAVPGTGLSLANAQAINATMQPFSAAQTLGLVPAGGLLPVQMGADAARQAASRLAAAINAKQPKKEHEDDGAPKDDAAGESSSSAAAKAEPLGEGNDKLSLQKRARALPLFNPATSKHVSRIVLLLNMIAPEQIVNDDEYYCLCADIKEEAQRFGDVLDVKIPRRVEPELNEEPLPAPPGTGRVYIEYATEDMARAGCTGMGGRIFDGRSVLATFYSEEKWANGDLGPLPISVKFAPPDNERDKPIQSKTGGRFLQ